MRVGVGSRDITAKNGTTMGGYWGRPGGTQGAEDKLEVTVLVVQSNMRAIIVSLDLVGISVSFSKKMEARLKQEHGFEDQTLDVFISCTHTHTGPQTHDGMIGMGNANTEYMDLLENAVYDAARDALNHLQDVYMMTTSTVDNLDISVNRRERVKDDTISDAENLFWFEKAGKTKIGKNPDGPRMTDANLLLFKSSKENSVVATLVHFACHPTTIGMTLLQSADYVGVARRVLSESTCAPVLFLQGACGDINPTHRKGGIKLAVEMGKVLGDRLVAAVDTTNGTLPPNKQCESISFRKKSVQLPLQPMPEEEEITQFREQNEKWLLSIQEKRVNTQNVEKYEISGESIPYDELAPRACIKHAGDMSKKINEDDKQNTGIECVLHVLRLGTTVLVGISGEPFFAYQSNIARTSPFQDTWICGYVDGVIGYLPTKEEFKHGGYECLHAHCVYGQMQRIQPACESILLSESCSLVSSVSLLDTSQADIMRPCLHATVYDSKFKYSHDTYNAISVASDGNVYYALSCEEPDISAQVFKFSPKNKEIHNLGSLAEACGEKDGKHVVQGKSHVPFFENLTTKELHFGTHVGFYGCVDGMEVLPTGDSLPAGITPYPGGKLLSLSTIDEGSRYSVLGTVPDGEGVLTMTYDPVRSRWFVLTWPSGKFLVYEDGVPTTIEYTGREDGESVHPRTGKYRCVCRSFALVPQTGAVYFTNAAGDILEWSPTKPDKVTVVLSDSEGLHRDYLGSWDVTKPGSMAYHWRQVFYHATYRGGCVLGVHGGSGYLFAFHPPSTGVKAKLDLIERLTSDPSRSCGMNDQFTYGYLGFGLGPRDIIYYLTGGPIFTKSGARVEGKKTSAKGEAKGEENLHLVSYNLQLGLRKDHGPIFFSNSPGRPSYVNSLAIHHGTEQLYALSRLEDGTTDLFSVNLP
eukprot:m.68623 g.68623  ORF g.68623 m.68623 type:complete len:922 (-) comp11986_c0_seq1:86-2851(-)